MQIIGNAIVAFRSRTVKERDHDGHTSPTPNISLRQSLQGEAELMSGLYNVGECLRHVCNCITTLPEGNGDNRDLSTLVTGDGKAKQFDNTEKKRGGLKWV